MKKLALLLILSLLCNLLLSGVVLGQQGVSISQLKEQIARLEKLERDASLSAEVLNLNRTFLAKKRMELADALRARITALRKYQAEGAQAFSITEKLKVEDSIRALESELRAIEGGSISMVPLSDTLSDKPMPAPAATVTYAPASASRARVVTTPKVAPPSTPSSTLLPVSCDACTIPDESFVIDVSTGETFWFDRPADDKCVTEITKDCKNSKKTRFGKGDRIPVVVINKNPFIYKYTVGVQETVIVEDALVPFLKALSPVFGAVTGTSLNAALLDPAVKFANDTECPANKKEKAQNAYDAIVHDLIQLVKLQQDVAALGDPEAEGGAVIEFTRVAAAYNAALPHFARTRPSADFKSLCQELCQTAKTLQPILNKNEIDSRLNALQKILEAFKAQAERLVDEIDDFIESYPECQPRNASSQSVLRLLRGEIQRTVLAGEIPARQEIITQIRDTKKNQFDKMKTTLDALGERPDLLQETRYVGPFNDPTNVAIKVDYKGINAPDNEASKEAAKVTLNFGGDKRFNLSGGIAYGFMERPDVKPILSFERNRQGELVPNQTTPVTVIGLVDDSKRRIVPLLMLNTRITSFTDNNLFFSVGITGQADSTGTNIEYLIGPSLNILDRRVFLTYGFYGGKVQRLNEDLYFGLKIPDATTPDRLVRKDFIWKSGFGITYKIK